MKQPKNVSEFCEAIQELADKLGVNQKYLGILLPSMSASQVGRLVNKHSADMKFAAEIQYAYDVLLEADERGILPVAPKSLTPVVFKLLLDLISEQIKNEIMVEEFGKLDLSDEPDLEAYAAAGRKADELSA